MVFLDEARNGAWLLRQLSRILLLGVSTTSHRTSCVPGCQGRRAVGGNLVGGQQKRKNTKNVMQQLFRLYPIIL